QRQRHHYFGGQRIVGALHGHRPSPWTEGANAGLRDFEGASQDHHRWRECHRRHREGHHHWHLQRPTRGKAAGIVLSDSGTWTWQAPFLSTHRVENGSGDYLRFITTALGDGRRHRTLEATGQRHHSMLRFSRIGQPAENGNAGRISGPVAPQVGTHQQQEL
ncbi:unnamed protein product, partial [Ectocarpus fasciculatus]